jgi:predicted metalloprotease with PDZ domain
MQIKQNMNTLEEFLHAIESKISGMKTFNPFLSFTEMSRNVLEWPDEYMNVYYKGALINLCLDIKLREISNGAYGVQNLVSDLTNRYGKDKPFQDDDLFNDIYEITRSSDIKLFIEKYINGTEELPLKEMLLKVGFDLDSETGKITEIIPITESQRALRKHWINQ